MKGYTDITIGIQLVLNPKSWHLRYSGQFGCYYLELAFINFTFTKQFLGEASVIPGAEYNTFEIVDSNVNTSTYTGEHYVIIEQDYHDDFYKMGADLKNIRIGYAVDRLVAVGEKDEIDEYCVRLSSRDYFYTSYKCGKPLQDFFNK